MDYANAVERIFEHLEEDHVEKAVMGCVRIARSGKDYVNAAAFMRELYPNKNEVVRALYDELAHLKPDAQKFVFETSLERWLEAHTVDLGQADDHGVDDGDKRNVLMVAAGEIDAELAQWERMIADMTVPPNMGAFDAAAFTDQFVREKAQMRFRIRALHTIRARLKARCLNYAIQIERQLGLQQKSQGFLEAVQNDVNNYFKARSDEVFTKLLKAAQLAASDDIEDSSLLLTEVRRALKAAADHFYPPVVAKVVCADGVERLLGDDQYLNRLQEFLATQLPRSTAKDLLQAELDHLSSFMRRLNEMASKGVHSSVAVSESKQGLVGLYFFLFNVCQHLSQKLETGAGATAS